MEQENSIDGTSYEYNTDAIESALRDLDNCEPRKRSKAILYLGSVGAGLSEIVRLAREDSSDHVRLMASVQLGEGQLDVLVTDASRTRSTELFLGRAT